jgi:hypothetical protein
MGSFFVKWFSIHCLPVPLVPGGIGNVLPLKN